MSNYKQKIADCERETDHAQVAETSFCRCTHVMFSPVEEEIEFCDETRGGGGRVCSLVKGHTGAHIYECLSQFY